MPSIWFEDLENLEVFNKQIPKKPKYTFTKQMGVGARGNEVAMLQVCLAFLSDTEGYLFPLWQGQSPTGTFGGITRDSVMRFQKLYGLLVDGIVGKETLKKLNEIFK